ncbi:MAG: uracil-DNA glycosylase [Bacteroidetes bacterium]|nr:uracil-DNA glycosylase [Bacteroidota bacterium]
MNLNIPPTWEPFFNIESKKDYFIKLMDKLDEEYSNQNDVYPNQQNIFKALAETPLDRTKIVILGQDPYHSAGQANGLCFSVNKGITPPPSLKNIYKEIENELGMKMNFLNGDLSPWAEQGVLLLNCILSVRKSEPLSHKNIGWEYLTDAIIKTVSNQDKPIVFLLWGKYAQSKKVLINTGKNLILEANHPSPFSAYKGFFHCGHFKQANEFLKQNKLTKINWHIQ